MGENGVLQLASGLQMLFFIVELEFSFLLG